MTVGTIPTLGALTPLDGITSRLWHTRLAEERDIGMQLAQSLPATDSVVHIPDDGFHEGILPRRAAGYSLPKAG
jgi:hypothetical protein